MNREQPSDPSQPPGTITTTEVRKTTTETYEKRTTTETFESRTVTGGAKGPRGQGGKKSLRSARRRPVIGMVGCRTESASRSLASSRRAARARRS